MSPAQPNEHRKKLIFASCLLGLLLYVVLYFRADPARAEGLWVVFIPDQVVAASIGGDLARIGLSDRLFVATFASLILLWAAICGWLSLSLAGGPRLSRLESAVLSVAIGLNELSLLTLLLGLIGWLQHAVIFWFLFLATAIAGLCRWRLGERRLGSRDAIPDRSTAATGSSRQHVSLPPSPYDERPSVWTRHGLWFALPFAVLILLGGMMPPWEFDVREYHLQVPKEWYQAGRVAFLPHNVYGNMPLGAEMHAVLGMVLVAGWGDWWWGALVGKTVMACFAPLTALGLYAAVRRIVSSAAGAAAALLYISTPWVMYVAMTGLNEGAVACYALLAVAMLISWQRTASGGETASQSTRRSDQHDDRRRERGYLLLAGFFAGSTAACKYPALLFVVLPLSVWCCLVAHKSRWRSLGMFLLAVLLACGPWYAKNAVFTGNPFYPLVFGGVTRTPERMEQWNRAHRVPPNEQGQRYTPAQAAESLALIGWRSRWISPLLLPLAALAWLDDRRRRLTLILYGLTAWVLLIWWTATHRVDRFLVPVLPWAAWLAGMGLVWTSSPPWRRLATTTLVLGLAFNFLYFVSRDGYDPRLLVSLTDLRRDEPSEPNGLSRVSMVHRYLNKAVPDGKRVLLVGDAQPFDLEVPVYYSTCFDECLFERWMRDRGREQRLETLQSHGISHIYFHWGEIARYRSPGNYGFSDWVTPELVHEQLVRRQGLLRKVPLQFDPSQGELFEVLESDDPPSDSEPHRGSPDR